ncbi:unnamed protein product [Litomosoides sigmodontis]|uniref:Anti-proliferative protein domain-containing protein n=1 Tax=Litomosoides sigmodontis TaxID=42156 RepID=A0A3P6TI06_LITSI|nr:unnamed protein product [Litomosoides sigmodontis]
MYTEVKELINFLAIYMHHRIPRRRICLFMESYGNHLAGRFAENWKLEEPKCGESERTLVIKMGNCLNESFSTIATSIGIVEKDLAGCFPSPMFLYCNPGEVQCRVVNYAQIITVWTGDVNADVNYTSVPAGIASHCDTPNALDNVLGGSNCNHLSEANHNYLVSKGKELRSERSIPLQLVSLMDDSASHLLQSGCFLESKVPPFLFCYTTKENSTFTARSFADTRFGSHRLRPDHQAMRRIQKSAAFLAMASDNVPLGRDEESAQCAVNPTRNSFHDNHPCGKSSFPSTTAPPLPLTSPMAANASIGQGTCDSSVKAPASALNEAVVSNECGRFLPKPSFSNSQPEFNGRDTGYAANQFYPFATAMGTDNDFNPWNYPAAARGRNSDERATCDERGNFSLAYPCYSETSPNNNYSLYSFETGGIWHYNLDQQDATGPRRTNQNEPISKTLSVLSLCNVDHMPSENSEKQIRYSASNNSDITQLQYDVRRMSVSDVAVPKSPTVASRHTKTC